jgi:hypothetical protein
MNAASLLAAEDSFLNSPNLSRSSSGYFSSYEDDFGDTSQAFEAQDPNSNNEFVCGECNRAFNKLAALRSHEVVHSSNRELF